MCVCVCVGPLAFSLHARKTTLKLIAKTSEEADEWIGSLQDVSINTIHHIDTYTYTIHVFTKMFVTSMYFDLYMIQCTYTECKYL